MAMFSEDLSKFQGLEERYREQVTEYKAEAAAYKALLQHDPKNPDLLRLYEAVQEKSANAQATYAELETLRRTLVPSSAS